MPGGNLLSNAWEWLCPEAERRMFPQVALFCIQGIFQWMLLYFPIAGVRQHWRKIIFCYPVWKMVARILLQEKTEGCIVTVKGDRRFYIFLWSMRLSGKKSKPTNNKWSVRRVQTLPFAGDGWLPKNIQRPASEGSLKVKSCWMQGTKVWQSLHSCPRFLLYEQVLIYRLPGSGWWLPHGRACQYMSASCMGAVAATDILVKAVEKNPSCLAAVKKTGKIWRYINCSLVNKGSFEMLNPSTEEHLACAGVGLVVVACSHLSATRTPCLHLLASDIVIWVWTLLPSAENKEHKRENYTASILNVSRNTCILFALTPGVLITFIHLPHFLSFFWFFNDNSEKVFISSLLSLPTTLCLTAAADKDLHLIILGRRLFISQSQWQNTFWGSQKYDIKGLSWCVKYSLTETTEFAAQRSAFPFTTCSVWMQMKPLLVWCTSFITLRLIEPVRSESHDKNHDWICC